MEVRTMFCDKCGHDISIGEKIVAVIHGVMTDPDDGREPPFGLEAEGQAGLLAHECCWDGLDSSDWEAPDHGCPHTKAKEEIAQ